MLQCSADFPHASRAHCFHQLFSELPEDPYQLPGDPWSPVSKRLSDAYGAHRLGSREHDALKAALTLHTEGVSNPTVARIAHAAQCSERTVQRAMDKAENDPQLRLVTRHKNYEWVGDHYEQRANTYEWLPPPDVPVTPKLKKRPDRRGRHDVTPISTNGNPQNFPSTKYRGKIRQRNDGPPLLAARQQLIQQQLALEYAARPKTRPIRPPG